MQVPGERPATPRARSASAHGTARAARRPVGPAGPRPGRGGRPLLRHSPIAVAIPTAPATSCVPLRRSRSWPPPCWRGAGRTRADHQRADADGPAELVRAQRHHVGAGRTSARSRYGAACTASVKTAARRPPAHRRRRRRPRVGSRRSRCWRHHRDDRAPRRERRAKASRSTTPHASTGNSARRRRQQPGRPGRLAHRRVLDRRSSPRRPRPAPAARPPASRARPGWRPRSPRK